MPNPAVSPPALSRVTRAREYQVALAAFAAVLWPSLLTLTREGPRGLVHHLASDCLYYVTVAAHSQGRPFFSFDGELPTNGFHPLWQILLTAVHAALEPGPEAQIALAFGIGALLAALGAAFLAVAMLHVAGRGVLALLATVPGLHWLVLGRPHPELLSTWSFVNGMETPLSLFLFGVFAWFLLARDGLRTPSPRALLVASTLLAALLLARLDDVFLVGAFVGWMALRGPPREGRIAASAWLSLVPFVALAAWLVYSQLSVGVWLPLSGSAKASGLVGGFLRNGYAVLTTFVPFIDVRDHGLALWEAEAMRVTQMLVPALGALLFLGFARPFARAGFEPNTGAGATPGRPEQARRAYHAEVIGVLALYALLKIGYNFGVVGLYHQGHWYFPLALVTVDLIAVWSLAPVLDHLGLARTRRAHWLAPACAVLIVAFAAGVHAARKSVAQPLAVPLAVWDHRQDLQQRLDAQCPACSIVSFDDAVLAFALENRVVNGLGLAADAQLAAALQRGELLEVAWKRGHRLLASASYPFSVRPSDDAEALRNVLAGYSNLRGQSLEGWHFELLFIDEATGATFVRFAPEPAGG